MTGICKICHKQYEQRKRSQKLCMACRMRLTQKYKKARDVYEQTKETPKRCVICGAVRKKKTHRYTCSVACAENLRLVQSNMRASEYSTMPHPEPVKVKPKPYTCHHENLDACIAAAKAKGLTYGEYMSQRMSHI